MYLVYLVKEDAEDKHDWQNETVDIRHVYCVVCCILGILGTNNNIKQHFYQRRQDSSASPNHMLEYGLKSSRATQFAILIVKPPIRSNNGINIHYNTTNEYICWWQK